MPRYEYKVVPAPAKGIKGKGVRGAEAKFAYAVQELMNGLSGYGWEYQRAETLPSIERSGLGSSTTEWRHVLVFRRPRADDPSAFEPELLPAPGDPETFPDTPALSADDGDDVEDDYGSAGRPGATHMLADNGVEETSDVAGMTSSLTRLAEARKKTEDPANQKDED